MEPVRKGEFIMDTSPQIDEYYRAHLNTHARPLPARAHTHHHRHTCMHGIKHIILDVWCIISSCKLGRSIIRISRGPRWFLNKNHDRNECQCKWYCSQACIIFLRVSPNYCVGRQSSGRADENTSGDQAKLVLEGRRKGSGRPGENVNQKWRWTTLGVRRKRSGRAGENKVRGQTKIVLEVRRKYHWGFSKSYICTNAWQPVCIWGKIQKLMFLLI